MLIRSWKRFIKIPKLILKQKNSIHYLKHDLPKHFKKTKHKILIKQKNRRTEEQYKINKEDPWKTTTIVFSGGEATGKYRHHQNTTDQNGEKVENIFFASVYKWETFANNWK